MYDVDNIITVHIDFQYLNILKEKSVRAQLMKELHNAIWHASTLHSYRSCICIYIFYSGLNEVF